MRRIPSARVAVLALLLAAPAAAEPDRAYPWREAVEPAATLAARLPPPPGFVRPPVPPGSFAAWLRGLPLKPGRPQVMLHDGRAKANQAAHHAVLDIDVGRRDLQQCADAAIRLRAEYLFAAGRPEAIRFNFTSGHPVPFSRWAKGERPVVRGNTVSWTRGARPDGSWASLRRYLDVIFRYAGSHSLSRELAPVADPGTVQAGDVFVRGGFPGHAVIVVDVAHGPRGARAFLLAQSYMPAQDPHVLVNPRDPGLSPWYATGFGATLVTPEWIFASGELRRWRD